jgi:hypothetical protein
MSSLEKGLLNSFAHFSVGVHREKPLDEENEPSRVSRAL